MNKGQSYLLKLYLNPALTKPTASLAKFSTSSARADRNETFRAKDLELKVTKSKPDLPDDPSKLLFGAKFTDHMFSVEWDSKNGWMKPKIGPFEYLRLHPAAKVLHYSLELFEGMKAYYGVDKKVRLFRPDLNMTRMHKSAVRSALPTFDKDELLNCLKKFVQIEKEWIPKSTAASLYLRPTLIGTEPTLGVSSSNNALLFIIASPIGPYFPTGFKPITLLADPKYIRAFPGGVGNCKVGSNYGPTIYVNLGAQKKGCQQVLWLFGENENLTEAGTMNMFLVIKNNQGETELITPPLDGTILEGVTRQSILDMARTWKNLKVTEREISMKEALELHANKRLLEMFGAGTACVVCPIDGIVYKDKRYHIETMSNGAPIMSRLSKELIDIHYGRTKSEWGHIVE